MTTLFKIFLPIYFALFFGLAMFWRSHIAWKHTGINPYKFSNGDTVYNFVGKLFRLTLVTSVLIVFVFTFSDKLYEMLVPKPWMDLPALASIGLALLVIALIWMLVAQIQMGDSWRIGIDEQTISPLVQNGLFSISRNPIFLGMLVMLATLVVTILGIVLIHIQVRLEESSLLENYGESYRAYQMRVRRWI